MISLIDVLTVIALGAMLIALIHERAAGRRRVERAYENAKRYVGPAGTEIIPFTWLVVDLVMGRFIATPEAGGETGFTMHREKAQRFTYHEAIRRAGQWHQMKSLIVPSPESIRAFDLWIGTEARKTIEHVANRPGSNPPPPNRVQPIPLKKTIKSG